MKEKFNWTRVNSDSNGNPRFVVHFLSCCPEGLKGDVLGRYDATVKLMNTIGGRKFHNKQFGGGIVFSSYNLADTEKHIERVKRDNLAKQRGA